MDEYLSLKRKAYEARLLAIDAVHEAKAGHPGGSLSCLDALTVLYFRSQAPAFHQGPYVRPSGYGARSRR